MHILLTSDKERKKLFQDIPGVGFYNSKSLKDHLFKVKSPNVEITGRSESCGKGQVRSLTLYVIQTLYLPKPVVKHSKLNVQSRTLNCSSQKIVYLLNCRIWGKAPYVGKAKRKFIFSYHKKCKVSQ